MSLSNPSTTTRAGRCVSASAASVSVSALLLLAESSPQLLVPPDVSICRVYLMYLSAVTVSAVLSCVLQQLLLAESPRQLLVPPAVSICCCCTICCIYLLYLSAVSICCCCVCYVCICCCFICLLPLYLSTAFCKLSTVAFSAVSVSANQAAFHLCKYSCCPFDSHQFAGRWLLAESALQLLLLSCDLSYSAVLI